MWGAAAVWVNAVGTEGEVYRGVSQSRAPASPRSRARPSQVERPGAKPHPGRSPSQGPPATFDVVRLSLYRSRAMLLGYVMNTPTVSCLGSAVDPRGDR